MISLLEYAEIVLPIWLGFSCAGLVPLMLYTFVIDWRHKGRFCTSVHYNRLTDLGFVIYISASVSLFTTLNVLFSIGLLKGVLPWTN